MSEIVGEPVYWGYSSGAMRAVTGWHHSHSVSVPVQAPTWRAEVDDSPQPTDLKYVLADEVKYAMRNSQAVRGPYYCMECKSCGRLGKPYTRIVDFREGIGGTVTFMDDNHDAKVECARLNKEFLEGVE
jgi:hypothetical protein